MNSKYTGWRQAFSKPLLVMFVMQLLLSAACISTANAGSMNMSMDANVTPIAAHCHSDSMLKGVPDMAPCSHCDTPDMGVSASSLVAVDMIPVLLAIIVLPEAPMVSSSKAIALVDQGAPSHSFSLLYQTSQRILI